MCYVLRVGKRVGFFIRKCKNESKISSEKGTKKSGAAAPPLCQISLIRVLAALSLMDSAASFQMRSSSSAQAG